MKITQGIANDIAHVLRHVNALDHEIALTENSIVLLSVEVEFLDHDTGTIGKVVYDESAEEFVFVPSK